MPFCSAERYAGCARVPPATRRRARSSAAKTKPFRALVLIAGGTPALPASATPNSVQVLLKFSSTTRSETVSRASRTQERWREACEFLSIFRNLSEENRRAKEESQRHSPGCNIQNTDKDSFIISRLHHCRADADAVRLGCQSGERNAFRQQPDADLH